MNITLTICGDLTEDAALQEIIATLHRRTAKTQECVAVNAPEVNMMLTDHEPKAAPVPEVIFETVRKAAADAMNASKSTEVREILKAHGGKLANMPPAEWPAVLAEIEAL